ncbi:MAG: hypothetical protein ACYDBH_01505 [Acidobacteriaceae bacterium]
MRYYDLAVTQPGSGVIVKRWTSYPNGKPDSSALNVLFDMPIAPYATPVGMQSITVEGISLADLTEAQQFAGMNCTLKGGMGGGLPLENPKQAGLIAQGQIFQSFGNWAGTDMRLDFILNPAIFTHDPHNRGSFMLHWPKGMWLGTAITNMLQAAYTGKQAMPISMNISNSLTNGYDNSHVHVTLAGISAFIANATATAPNGPVNITIRNGTIFVYDKTYQPSPIQIVFTDLIGQPTWIDVNVMQIKAVMRADLQIGAIISMPKGYLDAPGFIVTSAQSMPSQLKYKSTFTQSFQVIKLRQIGNFRSSDSGEWSTILNCVQL